MQNRCLSPLSFVESFPLARSLHAWHDTHKQPLFLTTFLRAQTLFARSQRTGQRRDKRLSAFRFRSRRESLGLPTDMGGGVTRRAFPSQPEPFGAHDTVAAGAGGDGTNRAGVVRRYRVPFSHGLDGTCKLDSIPSPSEPPARCARRSMPLRECAGRRRSPSPATGAVAIAKTGQSVRWRAVAAARREKQTEQVTLCPPFDTPNSRRLCASEPFGDGPILWMGVAKAASRLGCRRLPSTTASRSLVPAVRSWRARWPYGTSIDASAEKFPRGVTRKKQSLRPSGAGCEIRGTRVDGTGKGTSLHLIRATWTRRPGRGFPARGSSRTLHRPVRGEAMEEPSMDALGASMVPQWSPSQPLGLRLSSSPVRVTTKVKASKKKQIPPPVSDALCSLGSYMLLGFVVAGGVLGSWDGVGRRIGEEARAPTASRRGKENTE
ncbi:hypothetical protein Purlil1_5869 [Purpureocillium lilacinum]|uniref:Uncharacterized protein n=1 Tax=Purpureocillium lilacinum TaxID=33203 RepID=A0ABR0C0Z7_PURLI|nr:hypothetical protein Purlil1_5869 [Purpureocillium lilacinum]